ncbi:cation diffusion facilitator family transporter [Thermospira aquatica]|uniref:Cation transporter n=1 Tax=Thermospira aquatica TaxID=2828656 RepID=A0AAX3BC70_9SPIR|nr:cation diffusion facilitator family transporter [Thermospira aquatica]URA09784.1 cation transporter [Thermospira aquatica]
MGSSLQKSKQVTLIGLWVNIFLSLLKYIGGILGNSQTMIADATHSLSDLVTDVAVLFGINYWTKPPDTSHPYGHRRIETLVTALIALLLGLVGIGIGYEGLISLQKPDSTQVKSIAIVMAVISIFSKEILYRWTIAQGKKLGSPAIIANAWHHRSDALSSIPAFVAIGLSLIDKRLSYFDHIGAVVVSLFIIKTSWTLLQPVLEELSDRGASDTDVMMIVKIAESVEGVREVHAVRTRHHGNSMFVDLHVLVDGNLSVTEGHNIAGKVKHSLLEHGPSIQDVIIHIEPYETASRKSR